MNNKTIINTFNSDNNNVKTQHRQNITTITKRILKFKSMIRKQIMADNTFFALYF